MVPWGVTAHEVSEQTVADTRRQLRLDRPYVLFVGTVEPRKNLAGVIGRGCSRGCPPKRQGGAGPLLVPQRTPRGAPSPRPAGGNSLSLFGEMFEVESYLQ